MIHLVFGAAAARSLKHGLRKSSHKIIGFPIDFSVGPITNIHKQSGINYYFTWLKSSYRPGWNYFKEDQTAYYQSLQDMSEIEDGEQVTIWTCENASEQIGLRLCCYLLKEKQVELSFINTDHAMRDHMKHENVSVDILRTSGCSPEELAHFYKYSTRPISEAMKNGYVLDGEKLLGNKSMIRSWWQGEIVDDVETRDDPFILECATRIQNENRHLEFINVTSVIGEVLGNSEQALSDAWIEYRIRSLIHSHQLTYEGDLQSMRMYKIQVVS